MLPSNGAARCKRFPSPSVARRHACQPPSWTAREMPSPLSDAGCTLRPTHRLSVSRCSVTPLDRPSTVQCTTSTPGGIRTRSFRIESPASFQFDHRGVRVPRDGAEPNVCRTRSPCRCRLCRRRPPTAGIERTHRSKSSWLGAKPSRTSIGESSDGRDRTCASRLTVARLTARPHRNERRRQQDSNLHGGKPPAR